MVRNRLFRAQTPSLSLYKIDLSRYIFLQAWLLDLGLRAIAYALSSSTLMTSKNNDDISKPSYPMVPNKDGIFWSSSPKQFLNQNPENSIFL